MSTRTDYADGEPCWADVTTPDMAASKKFYGSLFGWTFEDSGPEFAGYNLARKGEHTVAGLTPPPPDTPAPPMWNLYLASSNVDETAALAEAAGAKMLMAPMDIPGQGRMLYAFDPTGAAFGVWQAGGHTGAQLFDEPGTLCWAEVNTRDPEAADAFYRALFPYEQEQVGDGAEFDYTMWKVNGVPVCGRMRLPAEFPSDIPPHWMVYFAVDNTDETVAMASTLGGSLRMGPQDSPYGRWAVVSDPHGATFAVIARQD
jgi:uncharacterized protein